MMLLHVLTQGRHRNLMDATAGGTGAGATRYSLRRDTADDFDDEELRETETEGYGTGTSDMGGGEQEEADNQLPDKVPELNQMKYSLMKSKRANFKSMSETELHSTNHLIGLIEEKVKRINDSRRRKDHALRAAINTPIQVLY